jgi:hypothetical protein
MQIRKQPEQEKRAKWREKQDQELFEHDLSLRKFDG